jgi:hypothetical protein
MPGDTNAVGRTGFDDLSDMDHKGPWLKQKRSGICGQQRAHAGMEHTTRSHLLSLDDGSG